jgi:hypothetical protein
MIMREMMRKSSTMTIKIMKWRRVTLNCRLRTRPSPSRMETTRKKESKRTMTPWQSTMHRKIRFWTG